MLFLCLIVAYPGALTAESLPLLKENLAQLPPAHYNLLKYLCRHLMKVAQHSGRLSHAHSCPASLHFFCTCIHQHLLYNYILGDNKMTPVSLSIVFGPNIFRWVTHAVDTGWHTQHHSHYTGVEVGSQGCRRRATLMHCSVKWYTATIKYLRWENSYTPHSTVVACNVNLSHLAITYFSPVYYFVFTQDGDSSRSSVRSSSDEKDRDESVVTVLTENSPSTTTFRRNRLQGRRKKPAKPRPYSDHMAEKQTQVRLNTQLSSVYTVSLA